MPAGAESNQWKTGISVGVALGEGATVGEALTMPTVRLVPLLQGGRV